VFADVQISLSDNANVDLDHNNTLGTSSIEVLDNKEIDDTLDEFSKMLSDYSCDSNVTNPTALSAAQTRLESLFVPPGRTAVTQSNPSIIASRQSDSVTPAARGNPGASAEDEASNR